MTDPIQDLLRAASAAGVTISLKNGGLWASPKAALTPALRARIEPIKEQVVAYLRVHGAVHAATADEIAVFAAWDEHLGYAPVTVADLIRHAEQSAGLRSALGKAAGDAAALHALILSFADLTIGGHRIVPVGSEDAVVPNDGERRWRLASTWSIDLAAKKVKSAELFDNREVDL